MFNNEYIKHNIENNMFERRLVKLSVYLNKFVIVRSC